MPKILEATGNNTKYPRLGLVKGFSVLCPIMITHDAMETIIALQMVGNEQSVNSNWAALVTGGAKHTIVGNTIKLSGMKMHVRLNNPLPDCEYKETWMIHKQATLTHVNPALDFFYLIQFDADTDLQRFHPMLDKCISIPTLPQWTPYLWQKGRSKNLIKINLRVDAWGMNSWIVDTRNDQWATIISNGLSCNEITF